jgi:hypothetical protein
MRKPSRHRAAGLHHMHTYHMLVEVSGDPQPRGGGEAARRVRLTVRLPERLYEHYVSRSRC